MPVYVDGEIQGASAAPTGPAGGALSGTYPDPALNTANTAGDAVLKGTLTTAGDLIGASAANTPARVVPAALATVLTSNGPGAASTFQTNPGVAAASAAAAAQSTADTAVTNAATAQSTANAAIPKAIVTAVGDLVSASAAGVPVVIPAVAAGRLMRAAGVTTLPAYSTATYPDTVAAGATLYGSATNAVGALAIGTAGQAYRVNAGATAPAFSDLAAQGVIGSRPAASVVLLGTLYYATDEDAVYECVLTAASTYAWKIVWYNREMPAGGTAPLAWWKLQEAAGSTSFANSGSGGVVPLTATNSGTGTAVYAGTGCGPWGQPCVMLSQASTGGAYLESATGVIEPAATIGVSFWAYMLPFIGGDTFARNGKKYNAAFNLTKHAIAMNILVDTLAQTVTTAGPTRVDGTEGHGVIQGGWSLVSLTYDGAAQTPYVNGRALTSTAQTGAIDYGTGAGRTWYFGCDPTLSATRLFGQISDIRIYTAAQTAAWQLECYQRGVGVWQGT